MQYTRPMIDLVMQIRKFVPSEFKAEVKLANPELLGLLLNFYHNNKSTVTNALIKELLFLAGPVWSDRLSVQAIEIESPPKQSVRVYRGQTILDDKPIDKDNTVKKATKKMYRGQVVYE